MEEKVKERTHALETSKKELEKAYQAVFRSEKSRQHLVQNISHDLRTPLTSIKGYVGAILDGIVKEPEQQKKYLGRVIDKVTSLDHLVKDLMELSQLESRQLKLNFTLVSIHGFDVKAAKVHFQLTYPPGWKDGTHWAEQLLAMVDMAQLDRVFTNLLTNSLAHTPEGGRIELSFNLTGDKKKLLVEVSDTGTGIPEEDLPYIFERFYKISKARQTSQKSSGLGLAIAKKLWNITAAKYGLRVS